MEDTSFYLGSITSGQLNWPTSCAEPDDCRRGRRRHRQSQQSFLNAPAHVCKPNAPFISENTSSTLTYPFTTTSSNFLPSLPAAQSSSCYPAKQRKRQHQQNPHHYHDTHPHQPQKHSLKHTFSTSSKSPYLRPRPSSISDLMNTTTTTRSSTSTFTSSMPSLGSTNILPRFKMHSLLLFSSLCLLLLLCNTVPTGKFAPQLV